MAGLGAAGPGKLGQGNGMAGGAAAQRRHGAWWAAAQRRRERWQCVRGRGAVAAHRWWGRLHHQAKLANAAAGQAPERRAARGAQLNFFLRLNKLVFEANYLEGSGSGALGASAAPGTHPGAACGAGAGDPAPSGPA